jgi:hypothetical protein
VEGRLGKGLEMWWFAYMTWGIRGQLIRDGLSGICLKKWNQTADFVSVMGRIYDMGIEELFEMGSTRGACT